MKIDFSPFENALSQLEKSFSYYNSAMAEKDGDLREQFRAAVIQAFEFTYELVFKMIRRQLAQIVSNPSELKEMAYMDLMRTAQEAGLIRNAPPYKIYRDKRNITSHTYDGKKADEIITIIVQFIEDMQFVLAALKRRNPPE